MRVCISSLSEQDGSVASFRIETSELLTFWTGLERELHSKSLFRGPTEIRIRIGHGTPGRKLEPLVTLGVDKRSTFFAACHPFFTEGVLAKGGGLPKACGHNHLCVQDFLFLCSKITGIFGRPVVEVKPRIHDVVHPQPKVR